MTWLQIFALAGIIGTFLGIGLAIAAYFNGKHIKAGVSQFQEFLANMNNKAEQRRDTVKMLNY